MNLTIQSLLILRLILLNKKMTGAEVIRTKVCFPGVVYSALRRMQAQGALHAEVEIGDPRKLARPLKVTYSLTEYGDTFIRKTLRDLSICGCTQPHPRDFIGGEDAPCEDVPAGSVLEKFRAGLGDPIPAGGAQ